MKKNGLAIFLTILIIASACNKNKVNKELKSNNSAIDSSTSKLKWMKLNGEWLPLITDIDILIYSGKEAYSNKKFEESVRNLMEAEQLINKKALKNNRHTELLKTSKALKDISQKIKEGKTNNVEMDSILYKVCDVHMKNCWILKDRETDLWVPEEELQVHLDSSLYFMINNDSIKSQEELAKANWIINSDSLKYCDPERKTISEKIRKEMNSIKEILVKGEKSTIGKAKSNIARTYFYKADLHYSQASQISFSYDDDKLEGDRELAREIKASVFYLQRAFATEGISLSEQEIFELENALMLGNELLGGYSHPKEDITEAIKDIGRIMLKYRAKFSSEI